MNSFTGILPIVIRPQKTDTMKLIYTLLLAMLNLATPIPSLYLENRNNEAELQLFPNAKGGDLHHHFSGSIYAEPILEDAIVEDFYLNTTTIGA
jgi:adenosine deaminase/adenosine deaminase CECR1